MEIETQRLLIRDVKTEDEIPFVKMAADGSLNMCLIRIPVLLMGGGLYYEKKRRNIKQ